VDLDIFAHGGLNMASVVQEKVDQQVVQDAAMLAGIAGLATRCVNSIFPASAHNQQRVSLPLWQCSLRI
jgi:predicted regulator of Ras-like GTPase activity (Roadblock/LC7/MglB family)